MNTKSRLWGFLGLLLLQTATSATFTWTGATDGNWSTGANWDSGVPASATDTAVVFDTDTTLATSNTIGGGLTLNALTFTAGSGVRSITGNALRFDGTSPTLTMQNTTGSGNTEIFAPVVLNQTLAVHGGVSFTNQLAFRSGATISGTGGLRIESGITTINSANTYSGATVVAGGLVGTSSSAGFGNTPSVTVQAGGGIQLVAAQDASVTINKPLTLAGEGAPALGGYALAAVGGNGTWSGAVTLAGDAAVRSFDSGVLTLSGGVSLSGHTLGLVHGSTEADVVSVSSVVSGTGGILVVGSGVAAGRSRMTGGSANTFTGGIEIRGGTLAINNDNKLGNAANVVTLRDGGILRAESTFFGNVVIPASRGIVFGPGGGVLSGGGVFETLTVQAPLGGSQTISIERTVALDAVNTFDGILRLAPGSTLNITNEAALGSPASTLQLDGDDTTVADGAQLYLQGAVNLSATRTVEITGDRGAILVDANKTLAATFTGPGLLELQALGNTVIQLSGTNTHAGGTRIAAGTLLLDSDARLGAPGGDLGIGVLTTLRAANDLVIDASRDVVIGNGAPAPTIDTNGFDLTIAGNLVNDGASADLVKTGQGLLVLGGTSSIGGLLTIQAGGLGGGGTIEGNVSLANGTTLAPGENAGLLTIGGNVQSFGGQFVFELGGTSRGSGYDALDIGGSLALTGSFTSLHLSFLGAFHTSVLPDDLFTILQTGSGIGGSFANVANGERLFTADGLGSFVVNYGSGSAFDPNFVVLSDFVAVPEPAFFGAALALALFALAYVRRNTAR